MRERHAITLEELDAYINREVWTRFASSCSARSVKIFEYDGGETFRVTEHGEVVYLGDDKVAAINAYNEAP